MSRPKAKLSFITTALMNVRSLPAPVPTRRRSSRSSVAICSASLRRRPLIEKSGDERRDAGLVGRILRAAGPDDQPQADRRLLVMRDGDDLQAVRQRAELVGRELHVARRQRPRRPLGRPDRCTCAGARHGDKPATAAIAKTRATKRRVMRQLPAAARSLRHQREHQAVLRREVVLRDALHVGGRHVHEDVELAVGGRDVVVNHGRVRERAAPCPGSTRGRGCSRARTDSSPAAAPPARDRLGFQAVELGDERVVASSGVRPGWTMATA